VARRFDEGLESALTETQVDKVLEKNAGKMSTISEILPLEEVLG